MKVAKLCLGLITFVLWFIVSFYSCAQMMSDMGNGVTESTGAVGILSSIFVLIAGIVAIAARSSRGGAIATTILYAIVVLIEVTSNSDMLGVFAFIFGCFGLVFFISIFTQKYKKSTLS